MTEAMSLRWRFVLMGGLGGLVLWALTELPRGDSGLESLVPAIFVGCLGFFTTLLLMMGRVGTWIGVRSAALVGLLVFLSFQLLYMRFADGVDVFEDLGHFMALIAVVFVPLPYLIAAGGPGWRDYPTLFEESWSAVIRATLAWVFVGIVWLLIFLSITLLDLVGLDFLERLVEEELSVSLIIGTSLGLGLSVVSELQNRIPSRLVVRLIRLLTPAVFVVAVVFVLALLLRGFDLKNGWSAGQIILSMAALSIMLVTLVADKHVAKETDNKVLRVSARGLALLVPVLAALALWAVIVRVGQYGWMPDRLFAALLSGLALVYGVTYALAALRGGAWTGRVRRANPWLSVTVLVAALLWLSPFVNAERISAQSQVARILAADDLGNMASYWEVSRLGVAGTVAIEEVAAFGKAEGRADLVEWAAGERSTERDPVDTTALQKELVAVLPLIPATATGTRDVMLAKMEEYQLSTILGACKARLPDGDWTCVMVVADLIPGRPGEEAVIGVWGEGWGNLYGLNESENQISTRELVGLDGQRLYGDEIKNLLQEWQKTPPVLAPAGLNQLGVGEKGLLMMP